MIELLVIGATLTIAAWATGAQAHRRSTASRALDRYAQSRGLLFAPPPSTPRGASPRVLGSKDGVAYVFDLYRLGGEMRTRISSGSTQLSAGSAQLERELILSVSQRDAFVWKKAAALRIGDPTFDHAYVVTTGAAEDVEGLRQALPALLVLHQRAHGVWLTSDGWRVTVSWRGMESDPLVLDAAREALILVAGWHRPESPYR
jgi:hypothetical protein